MNCLTFKKQMAQTFLVAACITLSAVTNAQTQAKAKTAPEESINFRVYHQAISVGDAASAISAVHYMLAENPVKYASWQDTLAVLYIQSNQPRQAYTLADALITGQGYSDLRMEIKAVSAKALQQPVEALNAYASLYTKTHNPIFGYEQLRLEYGIHRLNESVATGNSLLQTISKDNNKSVTLPKADGKSTQEVSLKAAVSNIMGLAFNDLKDKNAAVSQFESALKESPEFDLAKSNLELVKAADDKTKK